MQCEEKLKLRSQNTSYCLIEVVTKAGLTKQTINYEREDQTFQFDIYYKHNKKYKPLHQKDK
jgi:hypothetical protein